jgi:hypothetical protein
MRADPTLTTSDSDVAPGPGGPADDGDAGPIIEEWGRTRVGQAALKAFPDDKVRELAAIVERRGFHNETAKLQFRTKIRAWAVLCLCEEGRFRRIRRPDLQCPRAAETIC